MKMLPQTGAEHFFFWLAVAIWTLVVVEVIVAI